MLNIELINVMHRQGEDMHFTWFSRRDGVFSHELTVSCPEGQDLVTSGRKPISPGKTM